MSNTSEPTLPSDPDITGQPAAPGPDTTMPAHGTAATAAAPPATPRKGPIRLDGLLLFLFLLLALLLGLFPIRNSDFWLHLAGGRHVAGGLGNLGVEPFSYTTTDQVWVQQSWLFDLGLYAVHSFFGEYSIAWLRALLTVGLAALLLLLCRPDTNLRTTVLCLTLALLTISLRLFIQPASLSLLLLAATLWLLWQEVPARRWWLIPLMALWANLDAWFILGLVVVLLVLLGEMTAASTRSEPGRRRILTLVLVGGLLACLVNPFTWRVFILPPELAWLLLPLEGVLPGHFLAAGLTLRGLGESDPSYLLTLAQWLSPLAPEYWAHLQRGLTIVGLSYYVLLVLGLLSFGQALGAGVLCWPRLLVWLVFAALGLSLVRLSPFFAVAAGPITALNWRDVQRQRQEEAGTAAPAPRQLGGVMLAAFLLLLVILAWPGWLHTRPGDGRSTHRVALEVFADPSLKSAAEQLEQWAQEGQAQRVFNLTPDLACYCAWFAPTVKTHHDFRFALFTSQAANIGKLRQALRPLSPPEKNLAALQRWSQQELDAWRVDHIALTNIDQETPTRNAALRALIPGGRWVMTFADGRTVLLGRQAGQGLPAVPPLDFNALAFAPGATPAPAPDHLILPETPGLGTLYLTGEPPVSLAARRAAFYVQCFDELARQSRELHEQMVNPGPPFSVGLFPPLLLASAPGNAGGLAGVAALANMEWWRWYRPGNWAPPGLPLLALRSARQGLAENPAEPLGWFALANAYNSLRRQEGYWLGRDPREANSSLQLIRRLQWTGALHNFVRLQPSNHEVHRLLAFIYLKADYLDAALEHLTQSRALMAEIAAAGPLSESFKIARKEVEEVFKQLHQGVKQRREYFEVNAAGKGVVDKVSLALLQPIKTGDPRRPEVQPGLALQALEELQKADLGKLGPQERAFCIVWEIRILLGLGRAHEAAVRLFQPDMPQLLGPLYYQLLAQAAAVLGDYQAFDRAVQDVDRQLGGEEVLPTFHLPLLTRALLAPLPPGPFLPDVASFLFWQRELDGPLRQMAEWRLLRGMIALEAGDVIQARLLLREFLHLMPPGEYHFDRALAVQYLAWLERYSK